MVSAPEQARVARPRDIDVLCIGNMNPAVQRQRLPWLMRLARLGKRWRVAIHAGIFGDSYRKLLARARIVLADSAALSPELEAALREKPVSALAELWKAVRDEGLTAPIGIVLALAAAGGIFALSRNDAGPHDPAPRSAAVPSPSVNRPARAPGGLPRRPALRGDLHLAKHEVVGFSVEG